MRLPIGTSVLLVVCTGAFFTARADGPDRGPVPTARALAPVPVPVQPDSAPHLVATPAAASGRPDARAEHLLQAAEHLRAAGLDSLADHVRALSGTSWPAQGARLWPAHQQAAQQQVLFAIKLIEVDAEKLTRLGLDFSQVPSLGGTSEKTFTRDLPAMKVVAADANLPGVVEALRKNELARVLSEPTLVTTIGRPASFHVGGEIPRWAVGRDGQPIERPERIGTSVDVVPHLAPSGNLRIDLRYEYSEVDRTRTDAVAGEKNPGIKVVAFDTGWEAKSGQTLAVARHWHPTPGDAKGSRRRVTVLLVTPQLVAPTAAPPISYN